MGVPGRMRLGIFSLGMRMNQRRQAFQLRRMEMPRMLMLKLIPHVSVRFAGMKMNERKKQEIEKPGQ